MSIECVESALATKTNLSNALNAQLESMISSNTKPSLMERIVTTLNPSKHECAQLSIRRNARKEHQHL